ncbi:hypothetical protein CONLIGDRAFT_566533 [Coniochaeta ligniaria NRRL 30616]|uniref:Heavy metal tolerance protein n=1 Tax=Coniochaeta ligniaria NRRL 30616 TaxID=1408157 RepID=A0A1J7J5L0_9PEZI|nr:hypothetical protein CONLIGDRAFT_566533 [Coniochaeta ligniaria NRRL 30616]
MIDSYHVQSTLSLRPPFTLTSILFGLHYVYPAITFLYYLVTSSVAVCTLQTRSPGNKHIRLRLILSLLLFAVSTYLIQLLNLAVQSLISKSVIFSQDTGIGLLSCILVYGVEFAGLTNSDNPVWYPFIGSLWMALLMEPIIETLAVLTRRPDSLTHAQFLDIAIVAARYLALVTVLVIYYGLPCGTMLETGNEAERQFLIPKEDGQRQADTSAGAQGLDNSGYGSVPNESTDGTQSGDSPESAWERRDREAKEQMEKRLAEQGNWFAYTRSFMVFFPYIWPVNNRALQLRAVLVALCLLASNFVNLLLPRQLGIVMDSLNMVNDKSPWVQVLVLAALKLVASEAGLSFLRYRLWLPVELYSFQAISTAAYAHVLNLSSDFHDEKSSSDIMTAMGAGGSLSSMLESVCFQAVPMLIDMAVASVYLSLTFGPYEGFITIATATLFVHIATRMISALKAIRRKEVSAYFDQHYVLQAGIQGWSTVACFNQIGYEKDRYSVATKKQVDTSMASSLGYMTAYAFQSLTLLCGLLAGLFLAVCQVTNAEATPGQFVMLLTYWGQLSGPLAFFAGLGKSISRDLISAEKLLEIMQTKPTVVSKEGASPLDFKGGQVSFDHVGFSYDKKKEILKDVSLEVSPGTTVAFVGPTGAGKSTILKLIDRFYDVTEGSIKIDGQDIRDVELSSLRAQIGVVPQSPIMFDDIIMNNVRYAKLSATDQEVFDACKAACIHDQILGFTDGYKTRVGERGIKLSGGELQRVAIARAILKRPAIVLLDEATSAVDTDTEQKIQEAFSTLCKDRTTFIVAHRLSTIINADHIIVIKDGCIVEQGSHDQLLRAEGNYADLWSKQVFLKPRATDGSNDQVVAEGGKTLSVMNDLTVEVTKSELAKVQKPTTITKSQNISTPTRTGDDKRTASHVREV